MTMSTSRLEDFGTRGMTTPEERLKEYKEQCRGLPKRLQARFWLMIMQKDPEVAKRVGAAIKRWHSKRGPDDDYRDVRLASIEEIEEFCKGGMGDDRGRKR